MTEQPREPESIRPDRPDEALDPANQSLADALRVSFWILKAVMLLLVLAFLGWSRHSGFFTVPPQQKALVLRFGAIKGAPQDPGKHWSWPYPIESRVMVDTRVKSFEIETFFFARDERSRLKTLDELGGRAGALTPGQDGCLISGDHNLLHALWSVEYQVTDVRQYLENVVDEEELVKAVLDSAVVRTIAHFKADDLLGDRITAIQAEVTQRTEDHLSRLSSGMSVLAVNIKMPTPPLQVRRAFLEVNNAVSEADKKVLEATRESARILNDVAGQAHTKLGSAIARYESARQQKRMAEAKDLEKEIDALLLSDETKGRAGAMIDAARSYKTDLIQAIRAEANRFQELKKQYDRNPTIVLKRLWEDTGQQVLEEAKAKVFLPEGQPVIIDINEPPRWQKQEKEAALKAVGKQPS